MDIAPRAAWLAIVVRRSDVKEGADVRENLNM